MKITLEIDDDDVRRVLGPLLSGDAKRGREGQSAVRLLSVNEVAYRLGVSRPKVYQLLAAGLLDSITLGATKKISPAALAEFLARPNIRSPT